MGLLDRFRNQPAPPKVAVGQSGRGHVNGFIRLEELNPDLAGQAGLQIFDRMYRSDADVKRAMAMVCNPIIAGDWTVVPYGGDDATDRDREIAEAVEWMAFTNMRPGFKQHLAEALPVFLRSGFCPFEQIWGAADYVSYEPGQDPKADPSVTRQTLLAPRKLGLRLPRSVYRWMQDEDGELTSITQMVPTVGWVELPAENLIYYRVGAEGDNWEGVSLLRPAYKHWYLKDNIEKLDALAQEREAMGVFNVFPPSSIADDSPEMDTVTTALANYYKGDTTFVIWPGPEASTTKDAPGWTARLDGFGSGQGGRDPMPSLNYHSDKIASSFIEEFMRLAQSGSAGARALGETQQEPFEQSVNALADIVADQWNFSLIPRFVALNFADAQGCPTIEMSEADAATLSELGTYVQGLTTAQIIHPDDQLEDELRARADMPPADPDARAERKAQEQEDRALSIKGQQAKINAPANGGDGGDGGDPPATNAHTHARQDRPLRGFEQLMALDQIEASIDGARAAFEQAGRPHVYALARAYAQDPSTDPDQQPLEDALRIELGRLYQTGRSTVTDELARQRSGGAQVPTAYSVPETYALSDAVTQVAARAGLAAKAIVQRISTAIDRLRVTGRHTPAQMQQAGEQAALQGLRAEANLNAAPALNQGRADQAAEQADEIAGSYYTSILDGARCDPCSRADDDVLRPVGDPVATAEGPPNPLCEGGDRCRCMRFYVLAEEAPASA